MLPKTTVAIEDEATAKKILRLIDALEENDDVQDVYANFDIPEHVLEAVASLRLTAPSSAGRFSGEWQAPDEGGTSDPAPNLTA